MSTVTSVKSFARHIASHKNEENPRVIEDPSVASLEESSTPDSPQQLQYEDENEIIEPLLPAEPLPEPLPEPHFSITDLHNSLAKSVVNFFLKSRDIHNLSSTVSLDLTLSLRDSIQSFSENFINLLKSLGHDVDSIPNLDALFDVSLEKFLSNSHLKHYIQTQTAYIAPQEYSFKDSTNKLYYIPISQSLKATINTEELYNFCINNNILSETPYFKENIKPLADTALYIGLYSDEFEVANPIGVSKKKHCLVSVYYRLFNLPEHLQSHVASTSLVLLAKKSLMNAMPLSDFFSPLIKELNEMYFKEISFFNNSSLPVIACFFSGDNLSVHPIVGLNSCFSSGYICRFCDEQFHSLRTNFNTVSHMNRHDHEYYDSFLCSTNGIQKLSPFFEVVYSIFPYFFPPDIMHDMLEGTLHITLSVVLKLILSKKIFTLNQINTVITRYLSKLSIAEIKKDHILNMKFPLKASTMLTFIPLFPLIFGDKSLFGCPEWRLLLLSIELLNIFLSRETVDVIYLKSLVLDHNTLAYELTNFNPKYKCKLHYLKHYPELFHYLGCTRFYWCMRFESCHQYFKSIVRNLKQFKNIPQSLTVRWQMRFYLLKSQVSSLNLLVEAPITTHASYILNTVYEERAALSLYFGYHPTDNKVCYLSDKIKLGKYVFSKKHVIVLFSAHMETDPTFFSILKLICLDNTWYSICNPLKVSLITQLNAYLIEESLPTMSIIKVTEGVKSVEKFFIHCKQFIPLNYFPYCGLL